MKVTGLVIRWLGSDISIIVGAVLAYEKPGSNILSEVVQVIVHSIFCSGGLMRLIGVWVLVQSCIIILTVP
jgi:hypothetical protein